MKVLLLAPGKAWVLLCAVLMAGSALAWWGSAYVLDWQPTLAAREPWRIWSAAFVHWSALHLRANLLGAAVVAAFGWAARLPLRSALAFALAWPLTHLALLLQPALLHYGGLSGVLHAGVAVGAVWIMATTGGAQRGIAAAVFAGLLAKLVLEEPWGPPLHTGGGWDIATAPIAHATGAAAGVLAAALMLWTRPARRSDGPHL